MRSGGWGFWYGLGTTQTSFELIVLAFVGEPLIGPRGKDHVEAFLEPFTALRIGDAVALIGPVKAAATDAELHTPTADVVQGGNLLGHAYRMSQRKHVDRDPNAESPVPGHNRR